MKNGRISIGVIGLGWVAKNRHIPCILKNKQAYLTGIVDENKGRISPLLNRYPWLQTTVSDNAEADWIDDLDAVVITTDPVDHFGLAKKMLAKGISVLLEKPMVMSMEEGKELKNLAKNNNCLCCVSHNFQYAHSVERLKNNIKNGMFGEILGLEFIQWSNPNRRLPVWYETLPLGLFFDESPHMFYLMMSLLKEEIKYLSSFVFSSQNGNTPLNITALYKSGNLPIRLTMNFQAALSEWHIVVFGSRNLGIVDVFRDILVLAPNDGKHRAKDILTTTAFVTFTHLWGSLKSGIRLVGKDLHYGVDKVYDKFLTSVLDKSVPADIYVDDGIKVLSMQFDIINKSYIDNLNQK